MFVALMNRFAQLAETGQWAEAESVWDLLDPMGRDWSRAAYRPGGTEYQYARLRFGLGDLRKEDLAEAEQLARSGKSRRTVREIHFLRGEWYLDRGEWEFAAESLQNRMLRNSSTSRAASGSALKTICRFAASTGSSMD